MKKVLIAIIFLAVAAFVCSIAPNYFIEDTYTEDEVRVIVNNMEITHNDKKMPQVAKIVDGKVMLSQDTVDILFDKWLYYDEKYDTLISTTDTNVAKLKLGENKIQIGEEDFEIEVPAQEIDGVKYIPIEDLQDFYAITVVNNEKIVITTEDADYVSAVLGKKLRIRAYKKNFSRTVATAKVGEKIEVFDYKDPEWVLVRTSTGDLGYARMNDIYAEDMAGSMPKITLPTPKVNLIWEYAENYTPNRSGESKIDVIDVVAPTWIYLNGTEGNLKNTIDTSYITWAHNNHYQVWATFKNDSMGIENTSKVVTDMKVREKIVSGLINLCKTYNLDGINLDFENMRKDDSEEFSQFVRELSAMLRQNNITTSVDVTVPDGSDTWSLCYNRYEIADVTDYLVVMTYDQYGSSSRVPGSTAELSWVESNIKKLVERDGIKAEKIVLGIPLYSRLWWVRNEKLSTSAISMDRAISYLEKGAKWDDEAGQYYVEYQDGNTTYMLWVEDENAINEKLGLIEKYDLAGAAYWRMGYETEDFWKKIKE